MAASPQKWEKVKVLFDAALELDPSARPAFFVDNCPDEEVRAEVERLLGEHDQAKSFLSTPALADFPIEVNGTTFAQRFSEGDVLAGRFRVVRFIASGGMGEVYEAEDQELRERVAVKIIRPEILAQPNAVARFKREVHLARKVTHPNVCRIFDLVRHKPDGGKPQEETVFISMELLHGNTLDEHLKVTKRLNESVALPLVQQMASALAAAHAVGIVHRDFKPGNVVLVGRPERWRAVVTDFGLAVPSAISQGTTSFSTGQGLLGTPAYMSPEQLQGKAATPASDVYALGLVIYEMVTGARPFQGDTPIAAALKRLTESPLSLRRFEPRLNAVWQSVIMRCLERDPTERFASVEAVAEALGAAESSTSSRTRLRKRATWRETAVASAIAVPLLIGLVAGGMYYRARQSERLTERDTIVLADFSNETEDPVFDDTLKTALRISLLQSPFLNVLGEDSVTSTLRLMARADNTKLTPDLARELCQRAGSKAYIAGSIASLGSEYVLGLKAVNCQTGNALTQEQVTASAKEKVLDAVGEAASRLRRELGESLATVQKFDTSLEQATTPSLEALRAYSSGEMAWREKGEAAALPYHQRAIKLDPNFAMGYEGIGADYYGLTELGRASEYFTKAFELREHASEREKLSITGHYYQNVTGELGKAAQTYQEWIESYPRDSRPHLTLGNVYSQQGQYEKASDAYRESLRLDPDNVAIYDDLANSLLALQRFDEGRQIIRQAHLRKLDDYILHNDLDAVAFLAADSRAMEDEQHWFASQPSEEHLGLSLASDTEAYSGHLHRARELTKRSVDSAIRADSKESGAIWQETAALREAAFGNDLEAKRAAAEALKLVPNSQGVEDEAALAFAMAGDTARAEAMAQDLTKRFPLDTQMQSLWLSAIRAQVALDRKDPAEALSDLQEAVGPMELAFIPFVSNLSCLYPTYVRGEAYLAAGQGNAAAAEFQKIIDHSGLVWNCWTGALANLGLARANALQSKTSQGAEADAARVRALGAYKNFLTLWKDADPEIPILKTAKTEYAKLQ